MPRRGGGGGGGFLLVFGESSVLDVVVWAATLDVGFEEGRYDDADGRWLYAE